jgi:hypothetical protein
VHVDQDVLSVASGGAGCVTVTEVLSVKERIAIKADNLLGVLCPRLGICPQGTNQRRGEEGAAIVHRHLHAGAPLGSGEIPRVKGFHELRG